MGDPARRQQHVASRLSRDGRPAPVCSLGDIAASAFFAGLEPTVDGATRPEAAKLLLPRIALDGRRRRYGYGVKLMPIWVPNLPPEQANLIDFYMHR